MRELWLKIAQTSGAKIFSMLAGMATLIVTARWLGPDGRGSIAAITTWVALFSTFGYLSLGQVALHRAARHQDRTWLPPVLGSLMVLTLSITLIGWTVALGTYWLSAGQAFGQLPALALLAGFLTLPFLIWEQYGSSLLMAVDRLALFNRGQLIGRTIGLIALPVAYWLQGGIVGVLLVTVLAQAIVSLSGLRELMSDAGGRPCADIQTVSELLKDGLKLHLTAIGNFLVTSVSILLLNQLRSPEETGYYQLAFQLINIMLIIPQSAGMVLYSKVSELGPEQAWPFQRRVVGLVMLGTAGMVLLAGLLAPMLIPLVAGERFEPSVTIFQALLPAFFGMSFSNLMVPQWIGRGLFWQTSAITITVGVCNLALCWVLIPKLGIQGAVWTTLISYGISFLVNAVMALRCELERTKWQVRHEGITG